MPAGGVVQCASISAALTRDGVMPVEFYTNQPAAMPAPSAGGVAWASRACNMTLPGPTRKTAMRWRKRSGPKRWRQRSAAHLDEPLRGARRSRAVPPEPDPVRLSLVSCRRIPALVDPAHRIPARAPGERRADHGERRRHLDRQARFTIGHWLNHPHTLWGLEGTIMFTGTRRSHATFASNGVDRLEHPFINAAVNAEDSLPVAIDAALDPALGRFEIEASSRLFGFEVNLRRELCRSSHGHFDMLIGYRQFHLDEAIAIRDRIVYDTAPVPLSDATVIGVDEFGTHNRIYAGQIGIDGELNRASST